MSPRTSPRKIHKHCWHDLGANNTIGTVNVCCQCAPSWLTIVTHVTELTETIKQFQQEHPIHKFIVATNIPAVATREEKHLRVIPQ